MEWTDEAIARLRVLWSEGLSTAEIGRRMGISKNAVVGKAHRLLLSPRPSPIRREQDGARSARSASPRRTTGPTLPSMALAQAAPRPGAMPTVRDVQAPEPAVPSASPRPVSIAPRGGSERHRHVACCWPIGEPGTRSFRFCDDDAVWGKPYCSAHAALAYVKVRDRREDAA